MNRVFEKAQNKVWFSCEAGTPPFRIREIRQDTSPVYRQYSASLQMADLCGLKHPSADADIRTIRTDDPVFVIQEGDVIYNLMTHQAAIVSKETAGCMISAGFVRLTPNPGLDPSYLVFLFNEDDDLRRQLERKSAGQITKKSTLRDLESLELPAIPDMETQQQIGQAYLLSKKLAARKMKNVQEKETAIIEMLKKCGQTRKDDACGCKADRK